MHTLLEKAAARIAAGTAPLENAAEAVELARLPRSENPDIFACAALARARFAGPVFTCAIINAKSGRCAENCAFCAQSSFHHTDAPVYGLVGTDVLLKHAEEMAAHGVKRFGIVTSGTTVSDRDLDSLCESARILRDRVDIALSRRILADSQRLSNPPGSSGTGWTSPCAAPSASLRRKNSAA